MKTYLKFASLLALLVMVLSACAPAATPAPTTAAATMAAEPTMASTATMAAEPTMASTATMVPEPTMASTATMAPTADAAAAAAGKPMTIVDIAVADGNFKTLVAALTAAGLDKTLAGDGPFTVFAPTDAAFAKLPAGTVDSLLKPENKDKLVQLLTYHVVAGKVTAADVSKMTSADTLAKLPVTIKVDMGKVMINNATVTKADIMASNGVIHVIDTVLMPPADIVDTAVADGRFKTLAKALTAAGLIDTLKGKGPFTVFAPTDDAFAKLPAGTIEALLADKAKLTGILTYHVVPGRVMAADVVKMTSATTVNGKPLTIKVDGGKVYVNDAQVIITDIIASNGVIHVIDTVLMPPQ